MQIRAFLKRSYKTTETCFYLKFTGFVTHPLIYFQPTFYLDLCFLSILSTLERKSMFRTSLTP